MFVHRFKAMASPCEVQIDSADPLLGARVGKLIEAEALRIEAKYSRYRPDSVVSRVNRAKGRAVEVDVETAGILDYAYNCFELSDGLIDITSGVLREIWSFKSPDDPVPTAEMIAGVLPRVGLKKAKWTKPYFQLPRGMEIDLGGLVKEYAVDRCLAMAAAESGSTRGPSGR